MKITRQSISLKSATPILLTLMLASGMVVFSMINWLSH